MAWAPLQIGWGTICLSLRLQSEKRHRSSICTTSEPLEAWYRGGLAPTGSMVPGRVCHNVRTVGPSVFVMDSLQHRTLEDSNRQLLPVQYYRTCALQHPAPPCLAGALMAIRWYHVGAMSIWQYSEPIVTEHHGGSRHDWHGATRGREQPGHVEGWQFYQTTSLLRAPPDVMRLQTRA